MGEIEWAVCRLWLHQSGGLSGMRLEHLQYWLVAATREERMETVNWERFVEILQTAFVDGRILT